MPSKRADGNTIRVLTYLYDDIGRLLQVSGNDGSYVKTSYDKLDNGHFFFGALIGGIIGGAAGALSASLKGKSIKAGFLTGAASGAAIGLVCNVYVRSKNDHRDRQSHAKNEQIKKEAVN